MSVAHFRIALTCAAVAFSAGAIRGQAPQAPNGGTVFRVERLQPALDAVIATDATLETLGDRFALTEGPVWVRDSVVRGGPPEGAGYLLFSDNAANVIYKWQRGQPLSVFLEKSGF